MTRHAATLIAATLFAVLCLPVGVRAEEAGAPVPPPPSVRAWQTGLLREDRLEHASLSFTVGLGAGFLSRRPAAAVGGALALGLAKELRDRRHGGFDPVDLLADALGAGLAALATHVLER